MNSDDRLVPVLLEPTSTVGASWVITTSSALAASGRMPAFTRKVTSPRMAIPSRAFGRYPSRSKRRL